MAVGFIISVRLEAPALPAGLTLSWSEQLLSVEERLPFSLSLCLSLARKIGGSMLAAPLANRVGNLFFCRLLLRRQTATRVVNYVCVRIMLLR